MTMSFFFNFKSQNPLSKNILTHFSTNLLSFSDCNKTVYNLAAPSVLFHSLETDTNWRAKSFADNAEALFTDLSIFLRPLKISSTGMRNSRPLYVIFPIVYNRSPKLLTSIRVGIAFRLMHCSVPSNLKT